MTASEVHFPPHCRRRVRPDITPSRSVCRQLFGPVNHEQLRADLLREKKKLCDENTQKWNFDFENGVPLVGKYVWERLCSTLAKEKTVSSLPDRVSEMGTTGRLACFSLASTELSTTTTTTSSGTTISNDSCSTQAENESFDSKSYTKSRLRHIRKTKSSGKITDFLRSTKQQRMGEKRPRRSGRKSTPKQTSMDLFIRKH